MKQPKPIASYTRISQDVTGRAEGVASQLRDIQAMAAREGLTLAAEYSDNDVSADTRKGKRRPAYEALMDAVRRGEVCGIAVLSYERLWRGRKQRAEAVELLQAKGVALYSVKDPHADFSTASGRMVFGMLGELAAYEFELIVERQRRAMLRRVEAGDPPTGPRCYGYDRSGRHVVDAEAEVVRGVFTAFLAGGSLTGIAASLNARGLANRNGKPWTHNTVRGMLLNARYVVLRMYEGKLWQGNWPAIVTEDVWRTAGERLRDPGRTTSPGPASRWLLSGIATCGVDGCGRPVTSGSRGRRGEQQPVYRCTGPVKHLARLAEPIDAYVRDVVVERLSRPDAVDLLGAGQDDSDEVADARREAVALRAKLEGLAAVFADSTDVDDVIAYRDARRAVQSRLSAVEERLTARTSAHVLHGVAGAADVHAVWQGLALDRRRAIVALLAEVTILTAARASKHRFDPSTVTVGGPAFAEPQPARDVAAMTADAEAELRYQLRRAGWPVRDGQPLPQELAAMAESFQESWDMGFTYGLPGPVRAAVWQVVAEAPELSGAQREALRSLLTG